MPTPPEGGKARMERGERAAGVLLGWVSLQAHLKQNTPQPHLLHTQFTRLNAIYREQQRQQAEGGRSEAKAGH